MYKRLDTKGVCCYWLLLKCYNYCLFGLLLDKVKRRSPFNHNHFGMTHFHTSIIS